MWNKVLLAGDLQLLVKSVLDFYWDRSFEKEQYMAFHQQIEWALQYDLPIVIHSRDSIEQTISVVREHQNGKLARNISLF